MIDIQVVANGSSLVAKSSGEITSGMVGIGVNIEYDKQWATLNKTAFFKSGNFVRKREGIGIFTTVPWEVLRKHGNVLEIGLEGRDSKGEIVMPTVWATVGTIRKGAQGEIPAAPNPDAEIPQTGTIIDDSEISLGKTWSSQKIHEEIGNITAEGVPGDNGATFTPSVSEDGTLSWSNDKGLDNPKPVNIKGEPGYTPQRGIDYYTEADQQEILEEVIAALPVYNGEVEDV